MADIEPKIKTNKPKAKQIIFLYKIQLNRPYPVSQHVTISMQTFEKFNIFELIFRLDLFHHSKIADHLPAQEDQSLKNQTRQLAQSATQSMVNRMQSGQRRCKALL